MTYDVVNPYDGTLVAAVEIDEADRLDEVFDRARELAGHWRSLPLERRLAVVEAGLDQIEAEREDIARAVTLQMGKPIAEARAEVSTCLDRGRTMVRLAGEALAPDVLDGGLEAPLARCIEHVPLGVVFNIAAWNYPLLIPINVVVPALLAGNTVVLKHSARTPLTGQALARVFSEAAGCDVVQHILADHVTVGELIRRGVADYVAFTGSVRGGRAVYHAAAAALVPVGLELGGCDPAYVAPDCDLEATVEGVVEGAMYNGGQSCCAVERVYVHRDVLSDFIDLARRRTLSYDMGDPRRETTTMGPLASSAGLATTQRHVAQALALGAVVHCGGRPRPDIGPTFYAPTVLSGVPNHALAMQEETFGPLLPIRAVRSDQEALDLMAETRFGLTASVWTEDRQRALWFAQRLDVGTVYQNRCDYLDPLLPWTGVGESGFGSTLSRYGFLHVTRRKSLYLRAAR